MTDVSLDTLCAQAGHFVDPACGDVVPPVHMTSTFARNEQGELPAGLRYWNPTVLQAEALIAQFDGAREARLFGSGLVRRRRPS